MARLKRKEIFGAFNKEFEDSKWTVERKEFSDETGEEEVLEEAISPRIKKKFLYSSILIILIFSALLARLGYLQLIKGNYYLSLAEGNRIRNKTIPAARGLIYDREKNVLAKNVPNFEARITFSDLPVEEKARKKVFIHLSKLIGESPQKIEEILNNKGKKNPFEPILIKDNLTHEEALSLELALKDLPGVSLEKNPRREYPFKEVFAHIVGYTGRLDERDLKRYKGYSLDDYIGKTGLELFYEKELKGKNGKRQLEADASGKVLKEIAIEHPRAGNNLVTSLDSNLQREAMDALSEGLQKARVKKGAIVIEDAKTGEVLSLVSLPTFDNNIFATKIDPQIYNELINNSLQPLFNRAVAGSYLIGSTIKPVVAAGALQDGVINPTTVINCPGVIQVPNQYNPSIIYSFPCWLRSGHGRLNVIGALAQSCNVFFYTVGGGYGNIKGLGPERLAYYMRLFGLGETTGIDLPEENKGLVPDPGWKAAAKGEAWYQGDTYHMAIGQGDVLATPLQLANYTACLANGGILFQPRLVKQITDAEGKIIHDFPPLIKRKDFVNPSNIAIVRQGMRAAVTTGTARSLNSLPVAVAGKTGTAELIRDGKKHAWFTCFAPYEDPQIVVTVLIEEGGEGSDYAVPVAKRILAYYFSKK